MLAGVLLLVWRSQPLPTSLATAAPAGTDVSPPAAPARPQPAAPEPRYEEAESPRFFADGFCAAPDDPENFETRYTLANLISEESERRLAALDGEGRDEVIRAAHTFLSNGRVPDTVSAADVLLVTAREEGSAERMLELVDEVRERFPSDPYLEVMRARAAARMGRRTIELESLRKARLGLPKSPAVGLSLAFRLLNTPELDEAVAGLDAYLAVDPNPVVSRLRARLVVAADIQRDYARQTRDGVTLLWSPASFDQSRADALLRDVREVLDSASRRLGIPRRTTLLAVAYPGKSELLAVTCSPSWAGGSYDGTLRLVASPEKPSDRLLIDLQHEGTHAVLRPAVPDAPQWFHEGIAQVFSDEPIPGDVWQAMVRNRTWIPFESLDGSFTVFDKGRDAVVAYAEGRGLVEFMQVRGGDAALARALQEFQRGAKTMEVLAHANGQRPLTGQDLLAFLTQRLEGQARQ